MNLQFSITEKLLLAGCTGGLEPSLPELYSQVGDTAAWRAAQEHDICGNLAHKLADSRIDVPDRWSRVHQMTAARIAVYLGELDRVASVLAAEDIPVVALKNAGIARGIFQCLGCSPMGDVDLLVRCSDFKSAHELLVGDGYNCASRSPLDVPTLHAGQLSGGTEYVRELPGADEFWLELQWRPVAGRWIRPDQEPNADELIERSAPIPGSKVRLLSPEDNLLQVCLHTAKHSYVRAPGLRLHCDADRLIRNLTIDWQLFVRRVDSLHVRTAVHFSLAIPAAFMATPIPASVLDHLRPPKRRHEALWRAIVIAGLFHPKRPKFSKLGYLRFTAMLYDTHSDLVRALFPDSAWMKRRYAFQSAILVPLYHTRRWWDLAFRRTGI